MDSSQLVAQLKSGNKDSFGQLFDLYGKKIYSLAFRMCGNREDAEDTVQKAFAQAFMNMHLFREESSLYTWLYSITRNLCLRLMEKRKKSSFSSLKSLISKVESEKGLDNLSILEKQYYINQVKEGCLLGLLRCLSLNQRTAFILHVLLEVRVKDVAKVLDKSETAVRLLIHRAKQNLKNFLCRNCSLYDGENHCHCENLIHFSMKQGWIQKTANPNGLQTPDPKALSIEKEISDLKKVAHLFRSLENPPSSESFILSLQKQMNRKKSLIFSDKKVK